MKSCAPVPTWLLAAALGLPLLALGAPLVEVDDARYAEIPRAMAASGDWVLPSLDAMPYVEKPPLWYWLGAASIRALGPSEAAARLPMALLALLGLGGVWWLGSWLISPSVGRTAALACATSGLWLFLSHYLTLDLPVSVFLFWTTALILRVLARPRDAGWAAPLAWLSAALAFLSKGLIAVLFPAAWAVGLAALVPAWRGPARRLLSSTGVVLAALVAAPWLLAVQARRPDFLRTFFVEQHFQRFLTPRYSRGAPWWFYLAVVPAGLLPWTAAALAGLGAAVRRPFADPRVGALAAWILGVLAFFSASHSKLATYALPVVPHAALLAAAALEEGLPAWARRTSRGLGALLLAGAAAAALASLWVHPRGWPPPGLSAPSAGALRALGALALAALGAAQLAAPAARRPALVLGAGGALAGALALAGLAVAAPLSSARAVGLALRDAAAPADQVWTYGCYLHGLPFYAGRRVDKLVYFVGEFHYAKRDPGYGDRFGDDNAVAALPREGGRTFIVMPAREQAHFETVPPRGAIVGWRSFGPWALAEIKARSG